MATIPASENKFPEVKFAEGAAPGTPAANLVIAYAKSDGKLYSKDDAGTETPLGGVGDASDVTVSPAVNGETDVQGALEDHESRIDTIEAGTLPSAGVQKILVQRTTNFTTTNTNDSAPDYDTVVEDTMTSSWWDVGDADRLIVTADYDGLDAVFMAKAAWSDPGTSDYVEGKMYLFPSSGGEPRPIDDGGADEGNLLAVSQAPAEDNVNHFVMVMSDPVTVHTGDIIIVAWRTSTSQTAITYDGRVSLTLGAYIVGIPGPEGPAGSGSTVTVEDEGTPLTTDADTLNFTGAGVTASGTGTTKTINIPGTTAPPDCYSAVITSDVTMATPNTWTDSGLSLSLPAGTYLLQAGLTIRVTQTGTDTLAARFIESGGSSTVYANAPMSVPSNNGQEITIPLTARVTLAGTTTVKVQGIAVVRTAVIEADGNDASLADNVVSWFNALRVTAA